MDAPAPELDDHGLLRYHGAWVAVSPLEELALRSLLAQPGEVVPREDLAATLWPDGTAADGSLNNLVHRLRRRMRPLGLTIHTIRARGFLLEVGLNPHEGT
ncbi:MAG: winged helix-turn-helix domain-containing protein [Acidobacteria bacterium]|nr:winged helix-turn-helix domain-containing protein [Acidobacteriota bacterium]